MSNGKYIFDLSNFKERTSAHLPEGRYTVVVEDVEVTKTKATNNDMINVFMAVHAPGTDEHGRTIIDRLVQSEGALFRTVSFLQALGLQTPKKRLSINLDQWIGKRLQIEVEDGEPYNGRTSSEVRAHLPAPKKKDEDEADLDDEADDLDEEEQEVTEPAPKSKKKKAEPVEDDDEDVEIEDIDDL